MAKAAFVPQYKPKIKTPKKARGRELYAAVLVKADGTPSLREAGDWSCFVGRDKGKLIEQALKAKTKWEQGGKYGPYTVLVGKLTEAIKPVQQYTTEEL